MQFPLALVILELQQQHFQGKNKWLIIPKYFLEK
jgi:hypothetical protein